MKTIKNLLIPVFISSLIIISCKDNDSTPDPNKPAKTNTELLTDSSWILVSAQFNPPLVINLGPKIDTFNNLFEVPLYEDCNRDNRIKFNSNNTMTLDNGAKKCGSEPQTANDGIWKFINSEKTIQIINSEYFNLLGKDTVFLNNIVLSDIEMKGITEYEYNNPILGTVKTNVSFIFKK